MKRLSLLSLLALSLCVVSCKKNSVPSPPGQPVLGKIYRDGVLESEFIYESGKGLARINDYDTETGQLNGFTELSYNSQGFLDTYSSYNSSGKINSEQVFQTDNDGKFMSADLITHNGADSGKTTIRYKFEYNAEGLISKHSWNDPVSGIEKSYRLFFYYPNGNIKRREYYLVSGGVAEKALEVNYTPAGEPLPRSIIENRGYPVNFYLFLLTSEKIQTETFDVSYYDAGEYEEVISDRKYNAEGLVTEQTITTNYIQPAKASIEEKVQFAYKNIQL